MYYEHLIDFLISSTYTHARGVAYQYIGASAMFYHFYCFLSMQLQFIMVKFV